MLAMLAHAFLTVITAQQTPNPSTDPSAEPALPALVPLTRNEIRHLFIQLRQQVQHTVQSILDWSIWRRHHQAVARACLYRRQAETE